MCLGVPGRVLNTHDDRGTLMGVADFGGVTRTVCLAFTPEVGVDDYVIVHAGVAISVLDQEAARESLALFEELGVASAESPDANRPAP